MYGFIHSCFATVVTDHKNKYNASSPMALLYQTRLQLNIYDVFG